MYRPTKTKTKTIFLSFFHFEFNWIELNAFVIACSSHFVIASIWHVTLSDFLNTISLISRWFKWNERMKERQLKSVHTYLLPRRLGVSKLYAMKGWAYSFNFVSYWMYECDLIPVLELNCFSFDHRVDR